MISEKLTAFFKENGITQDDIAAQIGVSQSYVSALLTGKKAFGKKQAHRFSDIWGLSPSWLLTGQGPMLMESGAKKNVIPLYDDITTIGGNNDVVADVEHNGVSEMIDAGDWFPGATAAIHHYGDSMVEYPSGCILVLKRVNDPHLLINGENYVIETSEFRITKQILDEGDEWITAYSTNRDTHPDGRLIHAPIKIPKDAIRHMDLVVGCVIKKFGNPQKIR